MYLCYNNISEGEYYYGIRVVTGNQADCRKCDGDIKITLIGNMGMTDGNEILNWLNTSPKDSHVFFDIIIKCSGNLGEVLVVSLKKSESLIQQWYIDFVEIHNFQDSSKQIYPVYFWIGNKDSISISSATSK